MIRRRHKIGDYLLRDDESGVVIYASDSVEIWDGSIVHKSQHETRQPQEFVRAENDPVALTDVRPADPVPIAANLSPTYVGATTVEAPRGPAWHLFQPGIGEMRVGITFIVR